MDKPDTALRRLTAATAALAALPLLPHLPPLLAGLVLLLCLAGYLLPKPHRLLVLAALLVSLAMLMLAFHGRFGRDTAAGMLALMLALKCLETGSLRDLRALLGFALFLPFAALLDNQGPLTLTLALIGMLAWLFALQSTSTGALEWPHGRWRQVASGMGRQLLMALPLAAALFWLFPRIATPLWGLPGLSDTGAGLGDSMRPGQWLDTLADDRIAFRVSFDGPAPPPAQRYWRGPVLWDFDGLEWRRTRQDSTPAVQAPSDAGTRAGIGYSVSLEPTEKRYLPVLDWPSTAPAGYYLSADGGAYGDKPVQRLTQYRARALPSPPADTLAPAARLRALAYPRAFNPRTQALARQWRAEAADERAYIARVLQWIQRDFAYTLDTPEPGIHGVDDFLFGYRRGFCQHFSSSFALMMRAAGIPSRVVTGYAGGYRNPYGGYWLLYRRDAHAWNEVWLEGEGWVRVDPTAAVAPENILDTLGTGTGDGQDAAGGGALSPLLDIGDLLRTRWNDWMLGFNAARQTQLFRNIGLAEAQRWQMLLVLMALAALLSYAVFLLAGRMPEPVDPLEKAWRRVLAKLERIGLGKRRHETAPDYAARLAGRAAWSPALTDAARRYTALRYGQTPVDPRDVRALADDLRALARRIRRAR